MRTDNFQVREAELTDSELIQSFLQQNIYLHRHLDWHEPLYWLGKKPFFLFLKSDQLYGLLSFAEEPQGIAWARTFASATSVPVDCTWNSLIPHVVDYYQQSKPMTLSAVCVFDWFTDLLRKSGFQFRQDIITFYHSHNTPHESAPADVSIFRMTPADLPIAEFIDRLAFEPLWQTPLSGLEKAYHGSFYSTLIEFSGKTIGYLISTEKSLNAHLARIAVIPEFQGKGVATALIRDFLQFCQKNGIREITLNTQSDNYRSIALYKKLGFITEGLTYPVMTYQV